MNEKLIIEILSGLPGSGKSYYAKEQLIESKLSNSYNPDAICYIEYDKPTLYRKYIQYGTKKVILDGLFLTNASIIAIMKECFKLCNTRDLEFKIIHWKENRMVCLENDFHRISTETRKKDAVTTIKNAPFEMPDILMIQKETGMKISIQTKKIQRVSNVRKKIETSEVRCNLNGKYLVSQSWTLSGNCRSYNGNYNSIYTPLTPDENPNFEELDNLLTEICPNITFLDYKFIQKNFCTTYHYDESDYYSDSQQLIYVCNLEDLIGFLREKYIFNV